MFGVKISAWNSTIVKCELCRTPGCKCRAVADSEYCCQACAGDIVTPGGCIPTSKGVVPSQDEFFARRGWTKDQNSRGKKRSKWDAKADEHDAACAMLSMDDLQASWWEEFRCDNVSEDDAACLVVPPSDPSAASSPAGVVIFLSGAGHVENTQDFMWGGVDLLVRNPEIHERFYILAPKPTAASGLLRYNSKWTWTWAEDAVWALITEVLRRLGPAKVDTGRLYATGLSLGATGVWHLALRYGQHIAAIAPVAGACEWPGNSWPKASESEQSWPSEAVWNRLKQMPIQAYTIDVDKHAELQTNDMEKLCEKIESSQRNTKLPGMEDGKSCRVSIREWRRKGDGADWSLWSALGPLDDWSAWDEWGGDKHFTWQRVYPIPEWGLADFFRKHSIPQDRQWRFDSPSIVVDNRSKYLECIIKAAGATEEMAKSPWKEQVDEFVQKFFESLFNHCGDRPCFDKVDFHKDIKEGLETWVGHFYEFTQLPDFADVVRDAVLFGRDKMRYGARSWLLFKRKIKDKAAADKVQAAVNAAREEVVKDMTKMSADEFIAVWLRKSHERLKEKKSCHMLPDTLATDLFRDLVRKGGAIPLPMIQQMNDVDVETWKPLNQTINMLFDDAEVTRADESSNKQWSSWDRNAKNDNDKKSQWNQESRSKNSSNDRGSWDRNSSNDRGSWDRNSPNDRGSWDRNSSNDRGSWGRDSDSDGKSHNSGRRDASDAAGWGAGWDEGPKKWGKSDDRGDSWTKQSWSKPY